MRCGAATQVTNRLVQEEQLGAVVLETCPTRWKKASGVRSKWNITVVFDIFYELVLHRCQLHPVVKFVEPTAVNFHLQSKPEKNWLILRRGRNCISRAFKDAGWNYDETATKLLTGMYFDPFTGASPVIFPEWSVFVAEWVVDQCDAAILLCCHRHSNLGRCVLQSQVQDLQTTPLKLPGVSSQSCPQKSGGTDPTTGQPLARSFGQRDASSWGAGLTGRLRFQADTVIIWKKIRNTKNTWKQIRQNTTLKK